MATDSPSPALPEAELVCVGLATTDTIVVLPRWPEPDGRLVVEPFVRAGGGPAATAAVAAARLGRSVAFVGTVGNDAAGEEVRRGLAGAGVDVTHLATSDGPSAESVILVDRAATTRSIIHAPGVRIASLTDAAMAACRAAAWVHVDHAGWEPARAVPRSRLSVDGGNPIRGLDLAEVGLYAPTASAIRERYPGASLRRAVRYALDEGARRVAVTLGGEGALAADRHGAWRAGGVATDIVSTLGAGDVFHGALLAALIEGQSLPDAVRLANVAAALSCRALDGRSAIPGRAELEATLAGVPSPEPMDLEAEEYA